MDSGWSVETSDRSKDPASRRKGSSHCAPAGCQTREDQLFRSDDQFTPSSTLDGCGRRATARLEGRAKGGKGTFTFAFRLPGKDAGTGRPQAGTSRASSAVRVGCCWLLLACCFCRPLARWLAVRLLLNGRTLERAPYCAVLD